MAGVNECNKFNRIMRTICRLGMHVYTRVTTQTGDWTDPFREVWMCKHCGESTNREPFMNTDNYANTCIAICITVIAITTGIVTQKGCANVERRWEAREKQQHELELERTRATLQISVPVTLTVGRGTNSAITNASVYVGLERQP